MFAQKIYQKLLINKIGHKFSTNSLKNYKVCVCGAAGGIGQPLSLLLKLNPNITKLTLYDVANTEGVAADLSHIETKCKVASHCELAEALTDSDIVVIPAGIPRKPEMTRDDLFKVNCNIVKTIINQISDTCPKALIALITNPVNSVVPLAAQLLNKKSVYDKLRLFGVTTLDIVRARTFISEKLRVNPCDIDLPVIGGHAGITILPIMSQCRPELKLPENVMQQLVKRIQNAGTEVVEAKAGSGSATLSMAYAAASFTNSLICGLKGEENVTVYAYVDCNVTDCKFFATKITLGKGGAEKIHPLPKLNKSEQQQLCTAVDQLKVEIAKGIDFVKKG